MLVCTVLGLGIMADKLTDDVALALPGNTIPTGAILVVLITIFGPVSGAHFNPAVTAGFVPKRDIAPREAIAYVIAQIAGGTVGTVVAHFMFELPGLQASATIRTGGAQWFSERVATFGLMAAILGAVRFRPEAASWSVGLYITAACWCTASTSFANPAVAIARGMTDTFSGIRPVDLPGFIAAVFAGTLCAVLLMGWILSQSKPGKNS
jgi:glycerol uptake facilitator-like aquaporin